MNDTFPKKDFKLKSEPVVQNQDEYEENFDTTGMFHWLPEKSIDDAMLDPNEKHEFKNHVIACIFAGKSSPLIGLRNFVLPLRASNYFYDELKPIVFVGQKEFIQKEWKSIANFPKIFIIEGSPNSRSLLRSVNIQFCDMCVIISNQDIDTLDKNLSDKSAILCSLNIKAMNFDDTIGLLGRNHQLVPQGIDNFSGSVFGVQIPMITELRVDSNVQFLDQDDEDDPDKELYISQPFACGTAFAVSVLDCIMSSAYFNENALTLIRTLITGGATPELEQILAEGAGMTPSLNQIDINSIRKRPRIGQISLYNGDFAKFGEGHLYGELFIYCLSKYNMLCMGVYRFRDAQYSNLSSTPSSKRYVICNPNADFRLIQTDLIYVLQQFDPSNRKQNLKDLPLIKVNPIKDSHTSNENRKNKLETMTFDESRVHLINKSRCASLKENRKIRNSKSYSSLRNDLRSTTDLKNQNLFYANESCL